MTIQKSITITELVIKTTNAKMAEMRVNGVLRGGYVINGKFYYCGSVVSGCYEVVADNTLNVVN